MQRIRILLVDDTEELLDVYRSLLEKAGFTGILTCLSPVAALEHVRGGLRPLLVITDYHMPEMKGTRLLECVRGIIPDVKGVIITGSHDAARELRAVWPVVVKGGPDFWRDLVRLGKDALGEDFMP